MTGDEAPQPDRAVVFRDREHRAPGKEGDVARSFRGRDGGPSLVLGSDIPQPHVTVPADGGERRAVGTEHDAAHLMKIGQASGEGHGRADLTMGRDIP